jgi:hypothetical protein
MKVGDLVLNKGWHKYGVGIIIGTDPTKPKDSKEPHTYFWVWHPHIRQDKWYFWKQLELVSEC